MHQKFNPQIAVLMLIITVLGCSMLRPKSGLTWALTLEIDAPPDVQDTTLKQTVSVIESRLDLLNVFNFKIEPQGKNRVLVSLPDVRDRERLKNVILSSVQLELAHVISPPSPAPAKTHDTKEDALSSMGGTVPPNRKILSYLVPDIGSNHEDNARGQQKWVVVESPAVVTGSDLRNAEAIKARAGTDDYEIMFTLGPAGAEKLGAWTQANINQYLAVVLNDEVKSIAYIKSQIFDQGEITGRFTQTSAEDLAKVLKSGALPAPVKIVSETAIN